MASLRDGTVLQSVEGNSASSPSIKPQEKPQEQNNNPTSEISKKRKAPELDDETENPSEKRPSTPPPRSGKSELADEPGYEKTPGREGLVKPKMRGVSPDIKPFKGPPGKKVRKTRQERDEEYRQFAFENEDHTFHELYVCHRKGPNGSPTYDKSGFELDWKKVDDWMAPKAYNKARMVNGMERHIEEARRKEAIMKEIFFEKGEAPEDGPSLHHCAKDSWIDRVSKDLNIPFHKVGVEEFKMWEKKGFRKARKGEHQEFSNKELARFTRLHMGLTLRK